MVPFQIARIHQGLETYPKPSIREVIAGSCMLMYRPNQAPYPNTIQFLNFRLMRITFIWKLNPYVLLS